NHPAAPPAEQLTALVGRLTAGDRQVCPLLAAHPGLTTRPSPLLHRSPPPLRGRLTPGDRQVCRLLADHQVLTTGLLALLLDAPPRTLQQRLTTLTSMRVVDRFRPH